MRGKAERFFISVMSLGIAVLIMSLAALFSQRAHGKDLGQWENYDPAVKQWYETLMQPDNPAVSCCGEADAYWADKIIVRGDKVYGVITDDRDDLMLKRPHIPNGTEFFIPNHKLKFDRSNPTGHNIVFMSKGLYVYCFVQGTGI